MNYKEFKKFYVRDKNLPEIKIIDENNDLVNIYKMEVPEQNLVNIYIKEDDCVLELGGRYGSVSCIINLKLKTKTNHVVVEPDERVWNALEINKKANNCDFHIVKGVVSKKKLGLTNINYWNNGYGSTAIEQDDTKIISYTLEEVKKKYNINFNALVVDCEGCLEAFLDENPTIYDDMRLIMYEKDCPEKCNYAKIQMNLEKNNFTPIILAHQNIWIKNDNKHKYNRLKREQIKKELKFIHITKNAGTSIEEAGIKHNIKWGKYHKEYGYWHTPFNKIDKKIQNKYDWFLVVRNPYARILSEFYCYWDGVHNFYTITKEYMNTYLIKKIQNINEEKNKCHYVEQYKYIKDATCKIHILYFEKIEEHFNNLMKEYNLEHIKLEKTNTKPDYIPYTIADFSDELIKLINKVYKKDFKLFGYEKIKR